MSDPKKSPQGTEAGGGPDTGWLEAHEAVIRQATEALAELRREREELRARVEELEAEGPPTDSDAGEREAWHEERVEIRRRVESLTERLEGLLDDD